MSRRSSNQSPMSFFVFQDIIMAVTGIMILITLVLSLLVAVGENDAEAESNLATADDVTRRDELASKLAILNGQLAESQELLAKLADFDEEQIKRDIAAKENNSAKLNRQNSATSDEICLLYTSPSPRDKRQSRMPSSA